jgi:hypothetical protein
MARIGSRGEDEARGIDGVADLELRTSLSA